MNNRGDMSLLYGFILFMVLIIVLAFMYVAMGPIIADVTGIMNDNFAFDEYQGSMNALGDLETMWYRLPVAFFTIILIWLVALAIRRQAVEEEEWR